MMGVDVGALVASPDGGGAVGEWGMDAEGRAGGMAAGQTEDAGVAVPRLGPVSKRRWGFAVVLAAPALGTRVAGSSHTARHCHNIIYGHHIEMPGCVWCL